MYGQKTNVRRVPDRGKAILLLSWLGLGWSASLLAHPHHSSLTEIGWNEQRDTLQIALRVIPEDLEAALSFRTKASFVLAEGEAIDRLLVAYLVDFFIVSNERGERLPIRFLGKQVAHDGAWLYFEIPVAGASALNLANQVLCDWEESQINHVLFNDDADHQKSFHFTLASPRQPFWP